VTNSAGLHKASRWLSFKVGLCPQQKFLHHTSNFWDSKFKQPHGWIQLITVKTPSPDHKEDQSRGQDVFF
jgi:hypothetical protein